MRIIIASLGFISILTGPWWLPAICMVALCARWAALEAVFIGLLMDFIWQGSGAITSSWHTWPLYTIFGIILLWLFEQLRRRLFLT